MPIAINGSGTITGLSVGGLPDGIVDTDMIANNAVTSAKSSGLGGLTHACSYRVSANWDPADSWTDVTTNWEINDTAAYATLGDAVTESSGIFSFPATGFWYIVFGGMADYNGSAVDWISMELQTTHNNSTWTAHTLATGSIGSDGSGSAYCHLYGSGLVDVDNISNVKAKLRTETDASPTWHGSTANNQTYITFLRLGDT